jgi:hypothetical protein
MYTLGLVVLLFFFWANELFESREKSIDLVDGLALSFFELSDRKLLQIFSLLLQHIQSVFNHNCDLLSGFTRFLIMRNLDFAD